MLDVIYDYPAPYGYAGGYAFCPAGMKAVAWGATSSGLRDVGVTVGFTTFDGTGAFVKGFGDAGAHLQVSARCVDGAQVQVDTRDDGRSRPHVVVCPRDGRATCPPGSSSRTAAASFLSQPGSQPFGSVYASMPDCQRQPLALWHSGRPGQLHGAVGQHALPAEARVWGRSSPSRRPTARPLGVPRWPYPTLFTAAHCPTGYAAYAGGAWLHRARAPRRPRWSGT